MPQSFQSLIEFKVIIDDCFISPVENLFFFLFELSQLINFLAGLPDLELYFLDLLNGQLLILNFVG